jgi:hypothetical protein
LFIADGRTDRQTDRQTDLTKLLVDFHNFSKAHNDCDDNDAAADDNSNNSRLNIYWRVVVKAVPKEVRELNMSETGQMAEVAVLNVAKKIVFINGKRLS